MKTHVSPATAGWSRPLPARRLAALALGCWLAAGPLAGAVRAQSTSAPGPDDYAAFSAFITQRNIFDPNRYPREARTEPARVYLPGTPSAPAFALVGTMSYVKGTFAFFSGNRDEFKQVLTVPGTIAGYTVTGISLTGATLRGPDQKTVQLAIGDQLQQQNNGWARVAPAAAGVSGAPAAADGSTSAPAAAPSANLGSNDILKRLMQLRQQEK